MGGRVSVKIRSHLLTSVHLNCFDKEIEGRKFRDPCQLSSVAEKPDASESQNIVLGILAMTNRMRQSATYGIEIQVPIIFG